MGTEVYLTKQAIIEYQKILAKDNSPKARKASEQLAGALEEINKKTNTLSESMKGNLKKSLDDISLDFESLGGTTLESLQENLKLTSDTFYAFEAAGKPIFEVNQAFEKMLEAQFELAKANKQQSIPANIEAQAAYRGLSDKVDEYNDKLKENISLSGSRTAGGNAIAKDIRLGAEAYANLTDHVKENTRTKGVAAALGAIYDRSTARSVELYDHSASSTEDMTNRIKELNNELSVMNKATMPSSLAGLDKFLNRMDGLVKQGIANEKETIRQTKAYRELTESLEAGSVSAAKLSKLSSETANGFDKLDDASLGNLKSQIDSAKNALLDFNNQLTDTVRDLKDELDEIEGNNKSILDRDYKASKFELQETLKEAKKYNQEMKQFGADPVKTTEGAQAVKDAQEALALQEKIYKIKSKAIVTEQKEEIQTTKTVRETNNTNVSTKTTESIQRINHTLNLNIVNGPSARFTGGEGDIEGVMRALATSKFVTTAA